jgi:hypothetical protein
MGLFISLITIKTLLCTCMFSTDEKSIRDIIRRADLIIYAKAVPVSGAKIYNNSTVFVEQINFEIKSVLKGSAEKKTMFKSSEQSCAAHFRIGENYIVFAFKNSQNGELETGGCQSVSEWTKNDPENPKSSMEEEKRFFELIKALIVKEVKTKLTKG